MNRVIRTALKAYSAPFMLGLLLAGCQNTPRTQETSWIKSEVPASRLVKTIGLDCRDWESSPQAMFDPQAPHLEIESRFIFGEGDFLKDEVIASGSDVAILSTQECEQLLKTIGQRTDALEIGTPRLKTVSGQKASCLIGSSVNFIQEPGRLPRDEQIGKNPEIGTVKTGTFLGVEARLEDQTIVFEQIEPRMVNILGMRECEANVSRDQDAEPSRWQEPVILESAVAQTFQPVRLKKGQVVLIRLSSKVTQPAAMARIDAADGTVKERFARRQLPSHVHRSGVLDHIDSNGGHFPECVVLVTAKPADPMATD